MLPQKALACEAGPEVGEGHGCGRLPSPLRCYYSPARERSSSWRGSSRRNKWQACPPLRPGGQRAEGVSARAARRALQAEIVGVSSGLADARGTATYDHHGRTAGTATLVARAMDDIFGTHSTNQIQRLVIIGVGMAP
jgi:hypothetical protein